MVAAVVLRTSIVEVAAALGLAAWLGALAWIDWHVLRLPDRLTLPLVPAGLTWAWWMDGRASAGAASALPHHVAGAAFGFLVFAGLAAAYRRWRGREGLGFGDAKLMAGAGAWVGWQALPSLVLLASVTAIVAALAQQRGRPARDLRLPFGAFLAGALWIVWLAAGP